MCFISTFQKWSKTIYFHVLPKIWLHLSAKIWLRNASPFGPFLKVDNVD